MTCRVIITATGKPCGAIATYRLTFKDGDRVNACEDCTVRLGQQIPGAIIKQEKIK